MLTARIFHRALGVVGLALILIILWNLRNMFFPVPQSYDDEQIQCFAAILRADTIGEESKDRPRAQELVADVVNRVRSRSEEHGTPLSYCGILQGAITLYPPGWKHSWFFIGRDADTIRNSRRYVGSPWIDAEEMARRLIGAAPEAEGCAEYIVRVEKRYSSVTGENTAARQIAKTMKPDPRLMDLKTEFYCP